MSRKLRTASLRCYAGTWHIIDEGHITTIAVKNPIKENILEKL